MEDLGVSLNSFETRIELSKRVLGVLLHCLNTIQERQSFKLWWIDLAFPDCSTAVSTTTVVNGDVGN